MSDWSSIARELVELLKKGKQMSVKQTCAPINYTTWHEINWKKAHRSEYFGIIVKHTKIPLYIDLI